MKIRPVIFTCLDDYSMVPQTRFNSLCSRQFVPGEEYALAPIDEVSQHDRGGLFAAVRAAWENLSEEFDGKFPTVEHLRKWALIEVGHHTQAEYALATKEDAEKMALAARRLDEYARIAIHEQVVVIRTAKSIAAHAIKSVEFKALKKKVLDLVGSMSNSTAADLDREGKDSMKPNRGNAA